MTMKRIELGLFVLLWAIGICFPVAASAQENQDQERALRARVEEFYNLVQLGRWTQAEAYLTAESKENFRNQSRSPFLGFEVESVKLDPDGNNAAVTVRLQVMAPPARAPVPVAQTTRWRLLDGLWHAVVPKPSPTAGMQVFEVGRNPGSSPKPPEQLKFPKGDGYWLGRMQSGETRVARFPFTNVTNHLVTITDVLTGCKCLRVKTEKKQYKPGESGELAIEFDSTGYEASYAQTIVVKTDPGDVTSYLNIFAMVVSPPREAPKPEAEDKSKTSKKTP